MCICHVFLPLQAPQQTQCNHWYLSLLASGRRSAPPKQQAAARLLLCPFFSLLFFFFCEKHRQGQLTPPSSPSPLPRLPNSTARFTVRGGALHIPFHLSSASETETGVGFKGGMRAVVRGGMVGDGGMGGLGERRQPG